MMETTIEYLRTQFEILAKKIDVPRRLYPVFGEEDNSATPYILVEVLDSVIKYSFNVKERYELYESKITDSQDELFYWIFAGITTSMGFAYELEYREAYSVPDTRILAFTKSEELIGRVNSSWFQRLRNRNNETLLVAPINHKCSFKELEARQTALGLKDRREQQQDK